MGLPALVVTVEVTEPDHMVFRHRSRFLFVCGEVFGERCYAAIVGDCIVYVH